VPELRNDPIEVGGVSVPSGRKVRLELPFGRVPTGSTESLPVAVINGRSAGPNIWVSAAIHGDELNGIDIVRRLLRELDAKSLRGAVIAVPIVNPLGFITESRYLPDRRDLNRAFPGSKRGSTASRLANLFMEQVVRQCSVGFDLHTGTNHRTNAPQIRTDIDDEVCLRLARAFGAPFTLGAKQRKGSLREAAAAMGAAVLVYEGGQAHRFDQGVIDQGVIGLMRSLRSLEMIDARLPRVRPTRVISRSRWIRARKGGLAEMLVEVGDHVVAGQSVTAISDAFGTRPTQVKASVDGWIISRTLRPLVNSGDALVHIAEDDTAAPA